MKKRAKTILYLFGNIIFLILIAGIISLINKNFLTNKFVYCLLVIIAWLIFNFILKKILDIIFKTNDMLDQKYIKYSIKIILLVLLMVIVGDFWSTPSNNNLIKIFISLMIFLLGNVAIEYIFNHHSVK